MLELSRFANSFTSVAASAEYAGISKWIMYRLLETGAGEMDSVRSVRIAMAAKKYVYVCCNVYGLEETEVYNSGKGDNLTNECKFMAIYIIRHYNALNRREICRLFNLTDKAQVNKALKAIQCRMDVNDRGISNYFKEIVSLIK